MSYKAELQGNNADLGSILASLADVSVTPDMSPEFRAQDELIAQISEALDGKGLPAESSDVGSGDCDWNIMKNKPFDKEYCALLPEMTFEAEGADAEQLAYVLMPGSFCFYNSDKTYTVVFDGASYKCTAQPDEYGPTTLGNPDLSPAYSGDGEPFLFCDFGDGEPFICVPTNGTHTVAVYGDKLTQISGEFVEGMGYSEKAYDDVEWDGNTDGMVAAVGAPFYKVMEYIPVEELVGGAVVITDIEHSYESRIDTDEDSIHWWYEEEGVYVIDESYIFVVDRPGASMDGVVFPEPGVYFVKDESGDWGSIVTFKLTGPEKIRTIDPKYIPEDPFSKKVGLPCDYEGYEHTAEVFDMELFTKAYFKSMSFHVMINDQTERGSSAHIVFDNPYSRMSEVEYTDNGHKNRYYATAPVASATRGVVKMLWAVMTLEWTKDNHGGGHDITSVTLEYVLEDGDEHYLEVLEFYATPF